MTTPLPHFPGRGSALAAGPARLFVDTPQASHRWLATDGWVAP